MAEHYDVDAAARAFAGEYDWFNEAGQESLRRRAAAALREAYAAGQRAERERRWLEYLSPEQLCGLCGNRGVVDTRGNVTSPAGVSCGVRAFCLCPNGRALADQLTNADNAIRARGTAPAGAGGGERDG